MTTFNWSQPIRRTEKLSDALMTTHMESGINNGYVNIYRDEQEDFCGNTVFESELEATSVGSSVSDSFDKKTILFKTVEVRCTPY